MLLRVERRELGAVGGGDVLEMVGDLRRLGLLVVMLEEDVRRERSAVEEIGLWRCLTRRRVVGGRMGIRMIRIWRMTARGSGSVPVTHSSAVRVQRCGIGEIRLVGRRIVERSFAVHVSRIRRESRRGVGRGVAIVAVDSDRELLAKRSTEGRIQIL